MSNVIPFRDPYAPLEGEARDTALATYREYLKATVRDTVGRAFSQSLRLPECRRLGISDATPAFVEAMRDELGRMGYG